MHVGTRRDVPIVSLVKYRSRSTIRLYLVGVSQSASKHGTMSRFPINIFQTLCLLSTIDKLKQKSAWKVPAKGKILPHEKSNTQFQPLPTPTSSKCKGQGRRLPVHQLPQHRLPRGLPILLLRPQLWPLHHAEQDDLGNGGHRRRPASSRARWRRGMQARLNLRHQKIRFSPANQFGRCP